MREAMSDRKSFVLKLWLTSSLVLLAWSLVAQARSSGSVTVSSLPDCLGRNFALPPGHSTAHFSATIATDDTLKVDALPSEDEEQDRADALHEPRVSFLIACSFPKVPDRQLIAPRSILSLYPLRC